MINHNPEWSHPHGNPPVPSRRQATTGGNDGAVRIWDLNGRTERGDSSQATLETRA